MRKQNKKEKTVVAVLLFVILFLIFLLFFETCGNDAAHGQPTFIPDVPSVATSSPVSTDPVGQTVTVQTEPNVVTVPVTEPTVVTEPVTTDPDVTTPAESDTVTTKKVVTRKTYESPIDFATLQKKNPDIYAWIYIPDTKVSYPIVQHPTDDTYYLRRDCYGKSDVFGCIFTEHQYNSTDFQDPLTVVYGHTTANDTMFGSLQKNYSKSSFFKSHQTVLIYLPNEVRAYRIFAAVPYSTIHLLYYYNFNSKRIFTDFFDDLLSKRVLDGTIDKRSAPVFRDKVLVLSTCMYNNSDKRFLVFAKFDGQLTLEYLNQ